MAFTKAEQIHVAKLMGGQPNETSLDLYNKRLKSDLKACDAYIWPFSALMRFSVRMVYKNAMKRINPLILRKAQLDAELDSLKAKFGQSMKNIDTLQRSKDGDK